MNGCVCLQPLHKGLDPANLEQLITPLTTLGHLAQLAPEQFAAPLKSLVANFIVKDLLMNDRVQTHSLCTDGHLAYCILCVCVCVCVTVCAHVRESHWR